MCAISEVTIESSGGRTRQLPLEVCRRDDDDEVPAVVGTSDDEYDEGYSSMSEDEGGSSAYGRRFHELYLPEDCQAYEVPIVFSYGMDALECDEYHRDLDERDAAGDGPLGAHDAPPTARGAMRKRKTIEGSPLRRIRRGGKKLKIVGAPNCRVADDDDDLLDESSASSSSASSGSGRSVSFSDSATVFPVFSFEVFPPDVWSNIWTARKRVREAKRRAKIEFKYDGSDWRAATEEEDMIRDPRTGLLEHPVHYSRDDVVTRDEVVQMCLFMPAVHTRR